MRRSRDRRPAGAGAALRRTALPLLLALAAAPAAAQEAPPVASSKPAGWSALRVSKWSTAAVAAATAVYGFSMNRRSDARYARLERACLEDPETCEQRLPDGRYQDAALEAQYQEVRRLDRRARNGLLVSQVGVAASVVLFVLDLRNARAPDDILYEPRPLQVQPGRDGGVELRLRLPAR